MKNFIDELLYSNFFIPNFLDLCVETPKFLAFFSSRNFYTFEFSVYALVHGCPMQALTNSFLYLDFWGSSKKTTGRPQAVKATGAGSPEAQTKAIGRRELEDLLGSFLSRVIARLFALQIVIKAWFIAPSRAALAE